MPAPFLTKLYELVSDNFIDDLVSWEKDGKSFIVHKPIEFSFIVLPRYFKHNNFSSFVRQLNQYGFHKLHPDEWIFGHENFRWGYKHKLNNIVRRKKLIKNHNNTYLKYYYQKIQKQFSFFINYRQILAKDILDICRRQEKFLVNQKYLEHVQKKMETELNHLKSFIFGYFSRIILHEHRLEMPSACCYMFKTFLMSKKNKPAYIDSFSSKMNYLS
ncbi:heat shock transcription factor (nucleomorph) [Cryptomonas paramecium]|uniref:Heat shock transcription factor n=1 Tax=Cryptomonas paramaecium TaxID=2898 RepID=F2HHT3_9CRYP|nr:heat shock transcription factor [Cryptomonas paramecium]AEA38879.1 heat shock transcription factor [Cryptomonas paramecium]|mmetsp:Transcript_88800/g.236398  ORF Transcript_88800/g.236398 Transcript_88800/m.236398 type:complete len:216 (+) Transcript_88800:3658-4305(+)